MTVKKIVSFSDEQAAALPANINFSEWVRGLIRKDLGENVFPPDVGWGGNRRTQVHMGEKDDTGAAGGIGDDPAE